MLVYLLLLLPAVRADVPTPSSQLAPRNYNHHPFDAVKFVKSKPSKKGPILFPNDAPPQPPTPLIVTSRPLSESIARSELNPNNSLTAQSQLNHVSYVPEYLTRVSSYKPYAYLSSATPLYTFTTPAPYSKSVRKFQGVRQDHFYTDYERILKNTIHRRKQAKQNKDRWHSPIYRRSVIKKSKRGPGRRTIFHDVDERRHMKVRQRSLYSREKHYNDDDTISPKKNNKPKRFETRVRYESEHHSDEFLESRRPRGISRENESQSHRNRPKFETSVDKIKFNEKQPAIDVADRLKDPIPPLFLPERISEKYRKPHRYQVEQRFKTQDRYGKSKQSQEYTHYEPDHDTSKEYRQADNYAFSYTVKDKKTGDDFSHSQQSVGSATNGEYRVRLPDGRMQIVSYTADENGYKADVRYDGHDNSIDVDTSRENRYQLKHPVHPIHERTHYNEDELDLHSHGLPVHRDLQNKYRSNIGYNYDQRPTVTPDKEHNSNRVSESNNDFTEHNEFSDRSHDELVDPKSAGLTENNNEYLEHYIERNAGGTNEKIDRAHNTDYLHYSDEIPDYASDFNTGYQPHRSKFSAFKDRVKSTVTPSYDDLKDLFVTNLFRRGVHNLNPVSSTVQPSYETTTEKVVVISPKKTNLYTNIRDIVSVTPAPLPYSTPSSYLVSTIANLKSQVNLGSKPILSNKYIEKINKYLTYK